MFGSIFGALVIWLVGGFTIYSGLHSRRILPSNDHVRVVATFWPFIIVFGVGWCVWRIMKLIPREATKTVIAMQTVSNWRYNGGRLFPLPKSVDGSDRDIEVYELKEPHEEIEEAMREVEQFLERK